MHHSNILHKAAAVAFSVFLSAGFGIAAPSAENLIQNPDFESGTDGWIMFVPQSARESGCKFEIGRTGAHSGESYAALSSEDFARFALGAKKTISVTPKERYRFTMWVRAESGAEVKIRTQGVIIRFVLRHGKTDIPGVPAIFVGLNGNVAYQLMARGGSLAGVSTAALPSEWKKVEAVFDIPEINGDVDTMDFGIFGQDTKGLFCLDSMTLEKVDPSVPLSPVVFSSLNSD